MTDYATLNCNGVRIKSSNTGGLVDVEGSEGGLEINPTSENETPVRTVFSTYINVAGEAGGKMTGIFVNKFSPLEAFANYQNIPGPYETKDKYYPEYNKFWTVMSWEIQALLEDYNIDHKIDHTPSVNILTWPGKGNKYSREIDGINWPNRVLAPFFDRNFDGIYDPYNGEYPIISISCSETIPAEMSWSIFHGANNSLEIQTLNFAFESETEPLINNTVFSRVRFFNGGKTFTGGRFGLFFDFDLGCYSDDYFGTSPEKGTVYAYNRTEYDFGPCIINNEEIESFKNSAPTQSITCLNKKPDGSIMYDRQNIDLSSNDPTTPEKFYNYLGNKWNNGSDLTFGGSGYNATSQQTTNFIFPSSPADENGWSMVTAGVTLKDPRGFLNFHLPTVNNVKDEYFDFALTLHPPNMQVPHYERVDMMLNNIDTIRKFYASCYESKKVDQICDNDCVWPGDADNNGIVNNLDLLHLYPYINLTGNKRHKLSQSWSPQKGEDWEKNTLQDINLKHLDCNGNGIINSKDIATLKENLLSSNYTYTTWGGSNSKGNLLTFGEVSDSLVAEERFEVEMKLAVSDTVTLSGLGYTVEYDSTLLDFINVVVEKKWLDQSITPDNILFTENGKIHISLVKKNVHNDSKVHNVTLGTLKFRVKKEIAGTRQCYLKYTNYEKTSVNGLITELTSTGKQFNVSDPYKITEETFDGLMLYPNPTNGLVNIRSKTVFTRGEMCNLMGVTSSILLQNNSFIISNNTPGIYTIKLYADSGEKDYARLVVIK